MITCIHGVSATFYQLSKQKSRKKSSPAFLIFDSNAANDSFAAYFLSTLG